MMNTNTTQNNPARDAGQELNEGERMINGAIVADDRTPEQRQTHKFAVVAKDRFMSGWGRARGGASRCAWAVPSNLDIDKVERWVRGRSEMRYVNVVDLRTYRPPRGTIHFHIYVVNADHPSLS